ncbi:hypothetical protein [Mastigocoleus testarum]|uniref:Uncharacterized protein n=1 Tax=Mastigocoleus testarum BC008 TaxID=371196 RepID=A0A0V7ZF53_9CYAN|nr:hypothetical protein [Mastigocoleus testarum]KST62961.1 hypothetical protein BC008_11635 [Mastigocoleus testarum BC008]KST63052.1 hypothetical protein BC008_12110 [Mastigocoleus testarum BC008]
MEKTPVYAYGTQAISPGMNTDSRIYPAIVLGYVEDRDVNASINSSKFSKLEFDNAKTKALPKI